MGPSISLPSFCRQESGAEEDDDDTCSSWRAKLSTWCCYYCNCGPRARSGLWRFVNSSRGSHPPCVEVERERKRGSFDLKSSRGQVQAISRSAICFDRV